MMNQFNVPASRINILYSVVPTKTKFIAPCTLPQSINPQHDNTDSDSSSELKPTRRFTVSYVCRLALNYSYYGSGYLQVESMP